MIQSRYLNAFLLSALTFLGLYFAALSLAQIEKKLQPAPSKVIKVSLITPIKEIPKPIVKPPVVPTPPVIIPMPVVKKIEKKEPKKIIKKKIVEKKIIKKKVIKKKIIKKVVKKKVIKKKIVKKVQPKVIPKKVIPKPVKREPEPIERYVPPPIAPPTYVAPPVYVAPQPVIKAVPKPAPVAPQPVVNNDHHKKAFLRNVRSNIIANKKYPKIAKRRHIEGSVKVRFDITRQGTVSNIRFINGKSVFHKSIRKTLERTFPMSIPSEVRAELPISDVSVVLHFNIR
ncbi:MAG: Histone H1-like protein HC2 [uncultured Sulfurovum sp.]|uniref:Histone H1-like protein HC2 n=1 Tax=uncultured Sulfurovum sp. TaxID=269237 RepID=A0A6S6RUI8_9BACT|nr:MAG: Histone H1-like protein HC2 [uncultured Sulfurovum sp.]